MQELIVDILSELDLEIVVLFGSYASDNQNEQSDVDIAFLSKNEISNITRWQIQEKLASKINIDVDLVDMSKIDEVFRFQIASKGKVIYSKDDKTTQSYLDLIYMKYITLNEDRKEVLQYAAR